MRDRVKQIPFHSVHHYAGLLKEKEEPADGQNKEKELFMITISFSFYKMKVFFPIVHQL